jgi:poly-gamma-glutamate synthesis protein (capsule biosynthesis protein)
VGWHAGVVRRTVTALGLAAILAGGCAVPGPKAAPPVTRGTLPATVAPTPTYSGKAEPIPAAVRDLMVGRSWRPGCPVGLDQLRLLTVTYWGFDGRVHGGNLVVHQAHAQAVVGVFGALFAARFPIERVQLVDDFGANDPASMAANNTSAFNCRPIAGRASGASTATAGPSTSTRSRTRGCAASGSTRPPASRMPTAPAGRPG